MEATLSGSEAEIWNRAIRPDIGDLTDSGARDLLRLSLASDDRERVSELSRKANAGALSSEETQELDYYLSVGRALEFIKAKARLSLREHPEDV